MTSAAQMIADGIGCQNGLSADLRIRKRVVRLLIEEILATVNQTDPSSWSFNGKAANTPRSRISKIAQDSTNRLTNREAIEVVRELARRLPDRQIARVATSGL
jgi:hypothetical protein